MKENDNIQDDERLRWLLKNNLPEAPVSPWFTRKVLNRLPDRKRKIAGRIEIALSLVALILTLSFGIRFAIVTVDSAAITISNLLIYTGYILMAGALALNAFTPLVCRRKPSK